MKKEKVIEFLKELAGTVSLSGEFYDEINKHFKVIYLGGNEHYVPELDIRFKVNF